MIVINILQKQICQVFLKQYVQMQWYVLHKRYIKYSKCNKVLRNSDGNFASFWPADMFFSDLFNDIYWLIYNSNKNYEIYIKKIREIYHWRKNTVKWVLKSWVH